MGGRAFEEIVRLVWGYNAVLYVLFVLYIVYPDPNNLSPHLDTAIMNKIGACTPLLNDDNNCIEFNLICA